MKNLIPDEATPDEATLSAMPQPSYSELLLVATGEVETRIFNKQWLDDTTVQAFSAGDDSRNGWSEYHWEHPMWSSRDGSDSEWITVNEPGAFEPPYRYAFLTFHTYARKLAVSPGLQLVHERSVDGDLDVFCGDAADLEGNEARDSRMRGSVRFVMGADGVVTEAVMAMAGDGNDSACVEAVFRHGAGIEVPGLKADEPSDWTVALDHLNSCQALAD